MFDHMTSRSLTQYWVSLALSTRTSLESYTQARGHGRELHAPMQCCWLSDHAHPLRPNSKQGNVMSSSGFYAYEHPFRGACLPMAPALLALASSQGSLHSRDEASLKSSQPSHMHTRGVWTPKPDDSSIGTRVFTVIVWQNNHRNALNGKVMTWCVIDEYKARRLLLG